jgi:hypothetical protein
MTRPIFKAKANVTSKLVFGRTQDVGTLRSVTRGHVEGSAKW